LTPIHDTGAGLIVDDNDAVRGGIRAPLASRTDYAVYGKGIADDKLAAIQSGSAGFAIPGVRARQASA
jgi:hypothetical protein